MYHSITIGSSDESVSNWKNTWTHWHLIPTSRPLVNPPPVNKKQVEIPGRNGVLDLTEALTGSPTYGNRTGTWEFYVITSDSWGNYWDSVTKCYNAVMNYLHGKKMRVILEDDDSYYYEGRLSVQNPSSSKDYSTITIEYDLDPYRVQRSNETKQF